MANSVQRLTDEAQLMKPCTSFYISSQAFKFSKPLLCFFPPFLKVQSTSKFFSSEMWCSRNPAAILTPRSCKGHNWTPSRHSTHTKSQNSTVKI